MFTLDPIVDFMLRGGLAAIFAMAAWHKLRDRATFEGQLAAYDILPENLVHPVARAVPLIEAALVLFVLMRSEHASVAAASLFLIYAIAIGYNLARGRRDIDCGCGGPDGKQVLHPALVARNLVLMAGALALSWPVEPRALGIADYAIAALAALALVGVYVAFNTVVANFSGTDRLRR